MKRNVYTLLTIGIFLVAAFAVLGSNTTVETLSARGKPGTGSCTITSPDNGATVSGTITITVDASATPTIYIDGAQVATGYSYNWDTTGVTDGDYIIKAEVSKKTKDSITVTVANGGTPPPPPPPEGNKYALVIGISNYEGTANDLEYCDDDANDWANYLNSQGYQVTKLIDAQATANNILDAFADLAAKEQAGDWVAITYSGHGYYERSIRDSCLVSQDLYLVPSSYIQDYTDTFESTHVFVFWDCCNAGKFSNFVNTGWVAGVGSTTNSYTYDGTSDMKNGIYTYYAMEAVDLGYTTAEDIAGYAEAMFDATTPGRATTYDQYSGDMDI
jgi:hypothetical protein